MLAVIDTCRDGCLFSRIDDYRAYIILEKGLEQHWKAIGRLIAMPQPLLDGIDTFGFLEVLAGCSFDLARALYAYRLTMAIDWARVTAAFFYYDFNRTKVSALDAGMSRNGRRLAAQMPMLRKGRSSPK